MTYDVRALRREEFPWADQKIYLDHASLGPLPARTLKAVSAFNTRRAAPFQMVPEDFSVLPNEARAAAARLINADVEEIGLAPNTSLALALAAQAFPFSEGDLIVASDKEFPSNVYPWKLLRGRGVELKIVPCRDGCPDEEALFAALSDPRVKAIALSAVQFATGYRIDLARFSAETRKRGQYLIVDAIQAVGVSRVDVKAIPVDILACGAQKWLMSPWGSGFIYTRKELVATLRPTVASWLSFETSDDLTRLTSYDETYRGNARRFELTGHALQDFVGFVASANFLADLGVDAIAAHVAALHEPVIAAATKKGLAVVTPKGKRAATLSLRPTDPVATHAKLREAGVYCSVREGVVRLSPHCYNTMEEMERVAALL